MGDKGADTEVGRVGEGESPYASKLKRRGQTHRSNLQRVLGQTPTMQAAAAD